MRGLAVRGVEEGLREDRDALAHRSGSTPRPGTLREHDAPVLEAEALRRIVRDEQVPVEIDEVAERRELPGGGDAERALDHAAEHHDEPERPRGVHHAHGFADAARLGQLEVDAVGIAGHVGDVAQRVAALVDDQRDAAAERAQLTKAVALACRERLLDQLHSELDQHGQEPARLLEAPALVGVDAQRQVADGADGVQPLEVALAAELDLEPAVPRLGCAARAVRRAVDRVDADRVRRLGRAVREPEQAPGRLTHELAGEVVRAHSTAQQPTTEPPARAGASRWPRARTGRRRAASPPRR